VVTATPQDASQVGIDVSIDYAVGAPQQTASGLSVLAAATESVAAYVQPTFDGVQILTAIASADAPESYSYTLEVPDGTEFVERGEGSHYLFEAPGGDILGMVSAPWATDAAGNPVPTSFEWSGKTLTQLVDLSSPGIAFPVVADPDWTYGAQYDIGATNPGIANTQLTTCFNCYFPIEGAPAHFPSTGEDLPLVVNFAGIVSSFHCTMGNKNYDPAALSLFFRSASGHIDGLGSAIFFDVIHDNSGKNSLYVNGQVHNDFPGGLPNPVYVVLASNQWQVFADNLKL
jgi:hypothetical protein